LSAIAAANSTRTNVYDGAFGKNQRAVSALFDLFCVVPFLFE
jgi:hypothetical protein